MIGTISRRCSICCTRQAMPTLTVVYSIAWASVGICFLLLEKESPFGPSNPFSNPSQGVAENRYILVIKTQIPRRSETIGLYEPIPAPDGTRGVLFLDGHVARVS